MSFSYIATYRKNKSGKKWESVVLKYSSDFVLQQTINFFSPLQNALLRKAFFNDLRECLKLLHIKPAYSCQNALKCNLISGKKTLLVLANVVTE